jgi:hypothetical protein
MSLSRLRKVARAVEDVTEGSIRSDVNDDISTNWIEDKWGARAPDVDCIGLDRIGPRR